jgi:hypothetical protein
MIMAKVVFALGFVIGLAILGIAVIGGPRPSGVEAHETDMHGLATRSAAMTEVRCAVREIALDQGYGVTRKIMRRICEVAE